MKDLLNLGCGTRIHNDWVNIDFVASRPNVISHNLRFGIPFTDKSFDLVYHSHVLEHFSKPDAERFMLDCVRVLRPGGILRVAVPDLERIAQLYLEKLTQASAGSQAAEADYDWMMLELYEQAVRSSPNGLALTYLRNPLISNREFVMERWGAEAKRNFVDPGTVMIPVKAQRFSLKNAFRSLYRILRYSKIRREAILRLFLGKDYSTFALGRFRLAGSIHQWMYDRYSLSRLMRNSGLEKIERRTAHDSYVTNWNEFHLDQELDGSIYKPDSLFMEGIKP
jgi:SAM-dependent methyltransferase